MSRQRDPSAVAADPRLQPHPVELLNGGTSGAYLVHPPLWRALLRRTSTWIAVVLVVLCLIFQFAGPNHAFLSSNNVTAMLLTATEGVLLAMGMAFALGAGELDLSVGANVIVSSLLASKTFLLVGATSAQAERGVYPHFAIALLAGVLVGILSGVGFGAVNATAITVFKVNSFIATLATAGIGTGLALVITNGVDVGELPVQFQTNFSAVKIGGMIPLPVVIPVIIAPLLWWTLTRTRFGVHTLALGSSREAAVRSGISVPQHIFKLYALIGILAALAGFVDVAEFDTTSVAGHTTDALAAISACVIGGTSLFGGSAYIGGSIVGAMVPVILGSGLIIIGVTAFWQDIVVGIILLVAVYIDQRRRAARG